MYTVDVMYAARALRSWPRVFRPVVHWFLPETRKARAQVALAYRIIEPEIKERHKIRAEQNAAGQDTSKDMDALQWLEDTANGRKFDVVLDQLLLSFASIHTTSNLLQNVMYDLCAHPEYIDLLREKIITVLGPESDGWKKTSLHALKMMDCVLKESQRANIVSLCTSPLWFLTSSSILIYLSTNIN